MGTRKLSSPISRSSARVQAGENVEPRDSSPISIHGHCRPASSNTPFPLRAPVQIKVAHPDSSPEKDAAVLVDIRAAVGPSIELRADANRGWSLQQATAFGFGLRGCSGSSDAGVSDGPGVRLAYVEEPTAAGPSEWGALHQATGLYIAADESLHDGSLLVRAVGTSGAATSYGQGTQGRYVACHSLPVLTLASGDTTATTEEQASGVTGGGRSRGRDAEDGMKGQVEGLGGGRDG